MNVRVVCEGHFSLPVTVAEAVPLFTPEGERRWVGSSWDPVYAIPDQPSTIPRPAPYSRPRATAAPRSGSRSKRGQDGMSYARIVPGRIAGTITVSCMQAAAPDQTRVTVSYDVTSLSPEGAAFAQELEVGYDAFLERWRREIIAARAGGHADATSA